MYLKHYLRGHLARVTKLSLSLIGSAGLALSQDVCSLGDQSYQVWSNCQNITWQGIVTYSYRGAYGYYGTGYFSANNQCDPGGLNCNGSTRSPAIYQGSKSFVSWVNGYEPDIANFWWNVSDQNLSWSSCVTVNNQDAATVSAYTFTHQTGWSSLWCD